MGPVKNHSHKLALISSVPPPRVLQLNFHSLERTPRLIGSLELAKKANGEVKQGLHFFERDNPLHITFELKGTYGIIGDQRLYH
jgi:hypothetical protein